jgi:hypothetical protein
LNERTNFLPPDHLDKEASQRSSPFVLIMAAINKIAANSPSRQQPSELETSLAGALHDLETNTPDLKAALRPLQFVSAREVSIAELRNCCILLDWRKPGERSLVRSIASHRHVMQKLAEVGLVQRVLPAA